MDLNTSIDEIQQVKANHQQQLLELANVVGVGIGYKETGAQFTKHLALIVNVSQKLPLTALDPADVVPPQIDGVLTDVQETGPIRAL
jgi:hypothetical protein